MADPITLGLVGAGVGAMTNKDDPLKGAALGGLGGWAGGQFLGPMIDAGSGGAGLYGSLPGMTSGAGTQAAMHGISAGGQQAAQLAAQNAGMGLTQAEMLAAQTADFGAKGLLSTGQALSAPGSMQSGLYGMGNKLVGGMPSLPGSGKAKEMMMAGNMLSGSGRQPQGPMVAPASPPAMQQRAQGAASIRPYQPGVIGPNPSSAMMMLQSGYPGMNMSSPYRGR